MSLKVDVKKHWALPTLAQARSYRFPMHVTRFTPHPHGLTFPICPRCNGCLDREYLKFCNCCGQRLSWKKAAPKHFY